MKDMRYTFIGSGGKHPGIDGITSAGNIVRFTDYDEGDSIYNLCYRPWEDMLTAGDRGGFVKQFRPATDGIELMLLSEHNQGSPVISVAQFNGSVHSAGLDRKLFVWQGPDYHGDCCNTRNTQIVSLETLTKNNVLVSLAANGDMCIQDKEYRLVKSLPGPIPCGPLSFARLFYWQRHDVFVYASSDGQLVCREGSTFACKTFRGHEKGFVTLFSDGQYLYTVGLHDGFLKRWSEPGKCERFTCESQIVSGICLPGRENRVALINSKGDLSDCIIEDGVEVVSRSKGDFRCFMQVSGEDTARLYEENRQYEAESIQQTLLANIEKDRLEKNEALYRELEHRGYHKACLVLQSYEGQVCQNVVLEFTAKHKLFRMVSSDCLAPEFLYRYIGIALDSGQLQLACDIVKRCASILDEAIVDYVQSLAGLESRIVDLSGWEVSEFCDIWTIANKPIVGRVLFEQGTPLKMPVLNGSIAGIAKHVSADCPDIRVTNEMLLDSSGSSPIDMITFGGNVIRSGSIQIIPVLLQKTSCLYFAFIANIDVPPIADVKSHNVSIYELLTAYKGRLFDIVTEDQLQIVRGAVVKTRNERRAG